ncbi:MAG TPA: ATP-binding protein [Candidatus Angelobacter sp.]|nr:ATP-binding protein [Candidatus Angelobacter sp.]
MNSAEHGVKLEDALAFVCHAVETQSPEVVCSILMLDPGGTHLFHGAAPSLPESYIQAINGLSIGPQVGSCGTAAYLGKPVIVTDIASDPLWADFRDLALPLGLRACWSTPIISSEGKVLATFALYYREARGPSEREQEIVQWATSLTACVIEYKRISEDLKEEREELEIILDASPAMIWYKDRDNRILRANRGAAESSGHTKREVQGRSAYELYPLHAAKYHQDDLEVIAQGKPKLGIRETVMTASGKERFVITDKIPHLDRSGNIIGVIVFARDVTEQTHTELALKQAEDQLRQSQKLEAVGRLAGGVAHDFNNLLAIMKGHLETLADELGPGHPGLRRTAQIAAAADRAAAVTQQLLAFSRMQVLQPRVISLNKVVNDMGALLKPLVGENIEFTLELDRDLGSVRADPIQMEQVLLNLVVNACDAMPEGGRLAVQTANVELDEAWARSHPPSPAGRYVMLSVTDTGPGMDTETQARIFEPFFTTKRLGKGTGLGLATAYGIVKQSNGYLGVKSEPGEGASFQVYLPVAEKPAEPDVASLSSISPRGSETVLLVEDEEEVRELLTETLSLYGYKVLSASNGAKAITISNQYAGIIHLLVTDLAMPGISGSEVASRLRRFRPGIGVVYMSGFAGDTLLTPDQTAPSGTVLSKPFARDALASAVRETIDLGRAARRQAAG